MSNFEASVILPEPREEVFAFLRRPANLIKMFPASATDKVALKIPEIIEVGERVEFDVHALGQSFHFVHECVEVELNERITLQQVEGPFKEWKHTQHFADAAAGETELRTVIQFEPPGGMLGFVVTRKLIHSFLQEWVGIGHEFFRKHLSES